LKDVTLKYGVTLQEAENRIKELLKDKKIEGLLTAKGVFISISSEEKNKLVENIKN